MAALADPFARLLEGEPEYIQTFRTEGFGAQGLQEFVENLVEAFVGGVEFGDTVVALRPRTAISSTSWVKSPAEGVGAARPCGRTARS